MQEHRYTYPTVIALPPGAPGDRRHAAATDHDVESRSGSYGQSLLSRPQVRDASDDQH